MLRETYGRLTPWQKTQVARHPDRPHFKDYVAALVDDFIPLAGDRAFGEDSAIVGGLGRLGSRKADADRPRERRRHRQPPHPQFRNGQARRLSQGDPADGACRPLRHPRRHPRRHARRLSRGPGRGARPGRGDRPFDRGLPRARRADGRGDRRGRGLGRRHRHRHRQSGADARAQRLRRHLAGRLRLDPLAHRREGRRRGRGDAGDRPGPARRWE